MVQALATASTQSRTATMRPSSALGLAICVLLAAVLAACSNGATGTPQNNAGNILDSFGFDIGGFGEVTGAEVTDGISTGLDQSSTGTGSCEFSPTPETGTPGAPCQSGTECDSGFCVESAAGKICTRTCVDCCPKGFSCAQSGSSDATFICLPQLVGLCRPCQKDAECGANGDGALCVDYGEVGHFCGGSCAKDSDCPGGYSCVQAKGEKGSANQCVRTDKVCACSAKSIADGANTACTVSSEDGICSGHRACTAQGLSACDAPVPASETCDGVDNNCNGQTDEGAALGCQTFYPDADADGDGQKGGVPQCLCAASSGYSKNTLDCNDLNAAVHPGASEQCNGADDNCDGQTDEGFADTDGDGLADCVDPDDDNDGSPDAKDCAPLDPTVSPLAAEICNGKDDNCNGQVDEQGAKGCSSYWLDADSDGYGASASPANCLCAPMGLYTSQTPTDCDDTKPSVNPGVTEICNDKDDNCDGVVDEGCDADGDGYCAAGKVIVGSPAVCVKGVKDCNDLDPAITPGAAEICGNGLDDNCDGQTDVGIDATGCAVFFKDGDKDGYGAGDSMCLCGPMALYSAPNNKDCDDTDPAVHPGADEVCNNGKDDNCNGMQDEEDSVGCVSYYQDLDGDKYGDGLPMCLCKADVKYSTVLNGDCDPSNAAINPGVSESCNGIDDDCDGLTDEQDATGCTKLYVDGDKDGYGDPTKVQCLCQPTGAYQVIAGTDCNDADPAVHPNAQEVCNSIDDNCNGKIDEESAKGCSTWFVDGDGDGYGDPGQAACLCAAAGPYAVVKGGDCNDLNPSIHPGAQEVCDNVDNNCNAVIDEENATGCGSYLRDNDKDGYGQTGNVKCLCAPTAPYTATQGNDCDDADAAVNPMAVEVCNGGIDDNCDGIADPPNALNCTPFYKDGDADGFGAQGSPASCLCGPSAPFIAAIAGDCDDTNAQVNPKAIETCNGKDDDCNGTIDDLGAKGCSIFYLDADADGYGLSNSSQCACAASAGYTATKGGDCNDANAAVNPAAKEICNGIDDNCNGQVDTDAVGAGTFYLDNDGDGYGTGAGKQSCSAVNPYTATVAGDCNDNAFGVHPGAVEIQCNGIDEDCNGSDLCACQAVNEAFDSGSNGWSLVADWVVAGWCKYDGVGGLGWGTGGSSYCASSTSTSAATKNLAIPAGATKLTFWYRYSPDPSEYGGYDEFIVSFGGNVLVDLTAGTKGSTNWTQFTYPMPAGWAGTTKQFSASMNCKDGALNAGWGAAVDDIQMGCN